MRDQIEKLATLGEPDASRLIEHNLDVEFADVRRSVRVEGIETRTAGIAAWEEPNMLATMAWLLKPALIAALDFAIDSVADDTNALSPEAREVKAAEVQRDILAVEREEAALTWAAQAKGLPVEHRSDISPLALLSLRLITAPKALPREGSSPEHAGQNYGMAARASRPI
jgi:hypothetical protein